MESLSSSPLAPALRGCVDGLDGACEWEGRKGRGDSRASWAFPSVGLTATVMRSEVESRKGSSVGGGPRSEGRERTEKERSAGKRREGSWGVGGSVDGGEGLFASKTLTRAAAHGLVRSRRCSACPTLREGKAKDVCQHGVADNRGLPFHRSRHLAMGNIAA